MKTTSTSELGIFELETLERRIRFMARALPETSVLPAVDLADIIQEVTGYRCQLCAIPNTDDMQAIYDRVRAQFHVNEYVVTGEASFDRVRRASDDMLRVIAWLSDLEQKPYENLAAHSCRFELERRGVAE